MRALIILSLATVLTGLVHPPPALASTMYITTDGTGDAPTIQAGLDMCATGDTVMVAAGTYYENLVWPETESLKLLSESGDEVTAIDGDGLGRVIDIRTGLDETTVIAGFSIQNGIVSGDGAGILCAYESSPTIRDNTITGSQATGGGGGIYCYHSSPHIHDNMIIGNEGTGTGIGGGIQCAQGSSPTIEENWIGGNAAQSGGGIFCSSSSSPLISNNTITNNESTGAFGHGGGGIAFNLNCAVTVIGNTITWNTTGLQGGGGGIGSREGNAHTITGNTIENNTAGWGGGISLNAGNSVVSDNTISGNTAYVSGGGIRVTAASHTIELNNITGNHATDYGGGMFCNGADISTIRGNYFTNNTAGLFLGGGIMCIEDAAPTITYCEISGNSDDGVSCQDNANPVLKNNSIMNNMGFGVRNDNTAVIVNAMYNWWGDASGPGGVGPGTGDEVSEHVNFEPWAVAYIWVTTGVEPRISPARVLLMQNYPNPFNPLTKISFAVPGRQAVRLDVYTLGGRRLATLFEGELPEGGHEFTWDGRDDLGQAVASGTYLYCLKADDVIETKRMVLVR